MSNYRRSYPAYPNRRRFDFFEDGLPLLGLAAFVLFFLFGIGFYVYSVSHTDTVTCTVTDKDRAKNSEGGSDMRVYTKDCGTLKVADSLFDGTFSSSDTYASIEPGKTYTFDTRGVRVPILSAFPNIVEVHPNG